MTPLQKTLYFIGLGRFKWFRKSIGGKWIVPRKRYPELIKDDEHEKFVRWWYMGFDPLANSDEPQSIVDREGNVKYVIEDYSLPRSAE